jgi:hypothetical protein
MIETARGRLVLVVVLLLGQSVLFPLYAQQPVNPDAGVYPRSGDFLENPDQYIGERVVTGGIVQQVSPIVIEVRADQGTHLLTITGTTLTPNIGDKLRVYGTLTGPRTIHSSNAFVVPRGGLWYTWVVSFLAGLWVLARLIRHWTVEWSRLSFSRRDTPLTVRRVVARLTSTRGEDNA